MPKVFLSHSSKDKLLVRPIAKDLGNNRCIIDEMTFEEGMNILQEIISNIDRSDLFVIFLSDSALNSEWVQREILIAKENFDNNLLHRIYPIIIDVNVNF